LERQLYNNINKGVSFGIQTIKKIVAERKISGAYGPLIDLFTVDDKHMTAVEVTAGASLFYYVVDTDETASILLSHLNTDKSGRVTFMPLNRLNPKETPELNLGTEAVPMLEKLRYEPRYHKAFLQIFGKILICRNLEVATMYAKSYNLNCITIDGDQVNKRGALSGGYHDTSHSRLEIMKNISLNKKIVAKEEDQLAKAKTVLENLDVQISQILGDLQKSEEKRRCSHHTRTVNN